MKRMCKALILLFPLLVLGSFIKGGVAEDARTAFKGATATRDTPLPVSLGFEGPSRKYLGYKKGCGCHISQTKSWMNTTHAKVFDLLKPDVKVEEKKKAGLDPAKDYTQDKNCLPCHTTGYLKKGGYSIEIAEKEMARYLRGVTCEMCHGAGELYRIDHRKAGDRFNKRGERALRSRLVELGENFDYEGACARCHLNYKGSTWKGAKEPYTPFTPMVDQRYRFDFAEFVRRFGDGKAMHEHFQLKGVYEGEPLPAFHEEFQRNARGHSTKLKLNLVGEDEGFQKNTRDYSR